MSDSKNYVPLWDLLPLNSYLVSLFPVEDMLRFVPGTSQHDIGEVIRMVGAAWLLWYRQRGRVVSREHWRILVCLFVMDYAPIVYRICVEQWNKRFIRSSPTRFFFSEQYRPNGPHWEVAIERRQKIWKILQSIWPLLKLGLWLHLATSTSDDAEETASLYPVYGFRRWMHEEAMGLWPTLLKPLLDSSRETKRWIRQIIRRLIREHQAL